MARVESRGGARRSQYRRTDNRTTYAYVDGTAVRKTAAVPERKPERRQTRSTSSATRKNRERALQMNLGYVLFLTAAAVVTVFVCVNFLKLRAQGIVLQKQATALETQIDAARLENDSDYNQIMNSIDMEYVKDVAMNQLGMVYAKKNQIVTYEVSNEDYVRQYTEIPTE